MKNKPYFFNGRIKGTCRAYVEAKSLQEAKELMSKGLWHDLVDEEWDAVVDLSSGVEDSDSSDE